MALAAEIGDSDDRNQTSTTAFDRPVDLVHLSRYTLGNRSLEREVLTLFLTQSRLYVERLRGANCSKDWCDAAHTIKGSAKSIGAWQLARCAEKAETMSAADRKSGAAGLLDELERLISQTNSYIQSLLAEAADEVS